jgi:hypothetical protein
LPQKNFSTAATGVLVVRAAVEATACFVVAGAGLVVEATGVLVVGAAVEVTACLSLVVVLGVGVLLDVAMTGDGVVVTVLADKMRLVVSGTGVVVDGTAVLVVGAAVEVMDGRAPDRAAKTYRTMPPGQLQFLPCSAHLFHFRPSSNPNKQRQYFFSLENVYTELPSGLRVGSPKILSSQKIVSFTNWLLPTKSCAFFPSHIFHLTY